MTPSETAYKNMLTEYPDLLTAGQVAKILGTTRQTVYGLIDYGYLFAIKVGKAYKIAKIKLIDYLVGQSET
jgi:excisionase family DNA binding protein